MYKTPLTYCCSIFVFMTALAGISAAQDIKQWTLRADTEDSQAVLKEVSQYLAGHPQDYAALFLQARLLAKQGDEAAAINIYQQLITVQPDAPEAYNNLAGLYARQGDYEQAQKLLEQGMRTHPGYAMLYENLGQIYVERARDSYGKALQLDTGKQALSLQELKSVTPAHPDHTPVSETKTAAVVAPVSAPVAVSPAQPEIDQEAIITTLQGWAAAWSEQAADVYLIFYADNYTPDGMSRSAWEQQRRERLQAPEWIQISLSDFKVKPLANGEARVEMIQDYRASNYQDKTRKLMRMRMTADGWRIIDEQSIAVLN